MRGYLLLALLIVLFIGSLVVFGTTAFRRGPTPTNPESVVVGGSRPSLTEPRITFIDPVRGNPNASITIVEFGDYFCEFCAQIEPVVAEVLARYPRDARLVWKDFPNDYLHQNASRAAEAARCAGETGKYWEYHDLLFARAGSTALISFESLAETVGIDREAFTTCLESGRMRPRVELTGEEARGLGITGVPFFFINGEPFHGSTLEEFTTAINAPRN
ncbi:DsbA family protein [Candidatus Uhrbacteria bacterium]|nr:DsbA family protein [Candidatus Uhrbacteria bacterium]